MSEATRVQALSGVKDTRKSGSELSESLLDLPFDQYQRYRDVWEVVQRLRPESTRLRILDVGGGEGKYLPAPGFFPKDFVLVADLHDFKLPHYIRASGLGLPFADGAFDVVFSCDTLEHLRTQDRERFTQELTRVASRYIILVAPFRSNLNEEAERIVRHVWAEELGTSNQALLEHEENGLPDLPETQELFGRLCTRYVMFPSGNVRTWLIMNVLLCGLSAISGELYRVLNRVYNQNFYEHDHTPPAYRTCLIGGKNAKAEASLDRLRQELATWLLADEPQPPLELPRVESYRQAVDVVRKILRDKDVHIGNIESELRGSKAQLGRLRAVESLVRSQQAQLQNIQNSASWQIVQRFWRWNVQTFPFGSQRRRIYESTVGALGSLLLGKRRGRRNLSVVPRYGILSTEVPAAGSESSGIELNCDEPIAGQQCGGAMGVRGWAVAPDGIEKIEISLDGTKLAQALYGQLRPDVARDNVSCKDSQNSGFLYIWDSTTVSEGAHQLTISAYSRAGGRREMTVPIVVDHNLPANLYHIWTELNEPSPAELRELAAEGKAFSYRPLISIVVPVYRTPPQFLREAIKSVQAQIYENWELCLADDASEQEELASILKDYAERDRHIRITELPKNHGIAGATNAALALAHGEFVGFLDHDDTLAPDALYRVVKYLQQDRDADVIYSDEDKLDAADRRFEPFFKPDWSPDLLLSMNYVCHFLVLRRNLLEKLGGLYAGYDGAQDYELVLRLTERTNRIHHLPRVLYHWRRLETSTAASPEAKPHANDAAKRAITEHLKRNQVAAQVEPGIATGRWRVKYEIIGHPQVSIVLPTGGRLELLRPCLDSLFRTTDYPNYNILLVDNSKSAAVQEYITGLANKRISYIDYRNRPFNFSALNNYAVKQTQAPLLLFLNDDTTIVHEDWLSALVEHGQRPSVGIVGAKLVYPFGLIQHAGVVMGIFENTAHAFRNLPADSRTYFDFPQIVRNCSAVTAACMLTKRKLFLDLGGFNETRLAVAFQDVDYCLRVRQAGLFVVYTPYCLLVHHESVTKDEKLGHPKEVRYMQQQWAEVITNDPFYSPNLTRKAEDYSLRMD
jgi:GT2 family glycosyltransferase